MTEPALRIAKLLAIFVLAAALGGCIIAEPAPRGYYIGEPVAVAPPPPRVEEYGPPPGPGFVWIGGYWGWAGNRHEWVGGHWEREHRGERWVPHRWVRERDGYHLSRGHWERRR